MEAGFDRLGFRAELKLLHHGIRKGHRISVRILASVNLVSPWKLLVLGRLRPAKVRLNL